jgi:hypothetical protein
MTVRQGSNPIEYDITRRMDNVSTLTSGPAGVVIPVSVAPLLRGDSASGRVVLDLELAEMPKPLENAVIARGQCWFVPRPSLPYFSGLDDHIHSFHGTNPTVMGGSYTVHSYFDTGGAWDSSAQNSEFFKALGITHNTVGGPTYNMDYIDSYIHVQNFRLGAHSSKMTRYKYVSEAGAWPTVLELKPAFWPRNRMHNIVPDYEAALVKGSLDLDISAGSVPVSGIGKVNQTYAGSNQAVYETDGSGTVTYTSSAVVDDFTGRHFHVEEDPSNSGFPNIMAEMAATTVTTTLADIDKARTTQAFARAQAAYAGTNFSGFNNDDVIVADLMQGFDVPTELFNRPWLVDSKTTVFGMRERHATDAANLDDSMTTGRAQMALSVNIPKADYGGVLLTTVEVMPERLYERQEDPYLTATSVDDLPNALRDLQRTEPVDIVTNRRVDTLHTTPAGTFGYEPMNAKWRREFTRLGGEFRQTTPGTPITTARTAIWQADYVDPALTSDHWLCPHPFPQSVFSVPANDIVNIAVRQQITITGITQFGDDLVEDNDEFVDVVAEQV